jgi:hypothetical protein
MKQRDWVEEWENREVWIVFSQGGTCYGQVIMEEHTVNKEVRCLVRCICDMKKVKPKPTNHVYKRNIVSWHNSFKEAEDAYNNKFDNKRL